MTKQLESRIAALEERVAQLEEHSSEVKVIELREVTKEEARAEIIDIFATGETLYYSDIADRLRLDLELVVDICHELQQEGAIGVEETTGS
ncbi:hypothetical protein [Candidatus Poriferisocius sp.]|uniref:hypothetical protein n=1 Tax=Candidatus Poriferisocius sp. TaxID=3101276 RepID=UPI003B012030